MSSRRCLSILYVLSNCLDLGFTIYGINLTSVDMEMNLYARGIMMSYGFFGLVMLKLVGVGITLAISTILATVNWPSYWVKHTAIFVLLVGSAVSLYGAWSWVCVF